MTEQLTEELNGITEAELLSMNDYLGREAEFPIVIVVEMSEN